MKVRIGFVAPSGKVPMVELKMGLSKLKESGFRVQVHPQCRKQDRFFAGTDEERARAFFDFAVDPRFDVLWCARGGYGAARVLPLLDRMTAERGIPEKKLLLGYSDATALLEYARVRWGWSALHSPMPGMRKFCVQSESEWASLVGWIHGERDAAELVPWASQRLRWIGKPPRSAIEGPLVGGNLAVWASLLGTPWAGRAQGKVLFLEDIDEAAYRVDRMAHHLRLAGALKGVRAIVLGDFLNCGDAVGKVLASVPSPEEQARAIHDPRPEELKLLRKKIEGNKSILTTFRELSEELGIPVAYGLPAGHGPGFASLPLGAKYRLSTKGELELASWDWLRK